jgi:hypothetical protein
MLGEARDLIQALPTAEVGTCVLDDAGNLFRGDLRRLEAALASRTLRFHRGSIRGSVPRILER